jgi:peptide chain release factor
MSNDSQVWLQVTSGQGPDECALAAYKLSRHIVRVAEACGLKVGIIESNPGPISGSYLSALISIEGADSKRFALSWRGTVQWICESPLRPRHKRKNWFVGVDVIEAVDDTQPVLAREDVVFDTMRASGPGGQHVNKTESAVRATHLPSGLVVVSRGERSQHMNKKLALARLAALLAQQKKEALAGNRETQWQKHTQLERGNPIKVFVGMEFRERKQHG